MKRIWGDIMPPVSDILKPTTHCDGYSLPMYHDGDGGFVIKPK